METKAVIDFLQWIDNMIVLPDTPSCGDVICLDSNDYHPSDFCIGDQAISWNSSTVLEAHGDNYRVEYDDGRRWYTFKEFDVPFLSKHGTGNLIYCAWPPIVNPSK